MSGAEATPPAGTPAGTAVLHLHFAAGQLRAIELSPGSGNAKLDDWLLTRFRQGAQNVVLPASLGQGGFDVELPVEWSD